MPQYNHEQEQHFRHLINEAYQLAVAHYSSQDKPDTDADALVPADHSTPHTQRLAIPDLKVCTIYLLGYRPTTAECSEWITQAQRKRLRPVLDAVAVHADQLNLSYDELHDLMLPRLFQRNPISYMQQLFAAFDVSDRGFLTCEYTARSFRMVAEHMSDATIRQAFNEADIDGSGRIGYREFERMVKNLS